MKKVIIATAVGLALAGCNNGPDEAAMKAAIEEALGKHFATQMQTAMLQGNLNRAMEGLGTAAMISVGEIQKKKCEEEDKRFYCDLVVPLTARNQTHAIEANVMFWYVEKKLMANVHEVLSAPVK